MATLGVSEAYTTEQFQRRFDVNVFGIERADRQREWRFSLGGIQPSGDA